MFLKPREPFPIPIKWKEYSIGPPKSPRADSLWGIKLLLNTFVKKYIGDYLMLEHFFRKETPTKILHTALRNTLHKNIESQISHLTNNTAMVFKPATKKSFKNSITMGRVLAQAISKFALQ